MQSSCMAGQMYQYTQKITSVIKEAMLCVAPRGEFCGSKKIHRQLQALKRWIRDMTDQFLLAVSSHLFSRGICQWGQRAQLVLLGRGSAPCPCRACPSPRCWNCNGGSSAAACKARNWLCYRAAPASSAWAGEGGHGYTESRFGLALKRSQLKSRCLHVSKWLHPALFPASTHCCHRSETRSGKKKPKHCLKKTLEMKLELQVRLFPLLASTSWLSLVKNHSKKKQDKIICICFHCYLIITL